MRKKMSGALTFAWRRRWWVLAAELWAAAVLATGSPLAQTARGQTSEPARPPSRITFAVTPVSGVSWLTRLRISFDSTSMGRMGQNTPPASVQYEPRWNQLAGSENLNEAFVLSGSDLYRLDCESCHQPDGRGSPPEVHSLIEPVQAMSAAFMEHRMRAMGRPIDPAMARQVASGAEAAIRDRLTKGGQKMPPFEHLQGSEVEALLAFLEQLAGVPGADRRQIRISEPYTRVGEHLVKGTCRICHAATGPGTDPEALMRNVLPSLASFVRDKTIFQVIQKVRRGAPVAMGPARLSSGGRMPVFSYLTDDEVAAAYLYLIIYSPR
ncbi:MAG TPA: c-type cytochrome [Vicinamibacterales bacterium]